MSEVDMALAVQSAQLQNDMADKRIHVLDVPYGTTTDEAAALLEEPYGRGFYIHRAMDWAGGARVIYIQRAIPAEKPERAPSKEATAMQFMRVNREMTAKELAAAFKAIGFVRSVAWINTKRNDVIRAERRVI